MLFFPEKKIYIHKVGTNLLMRDKIILVQKLQILLTGSVSFESKKTEDMHQ